MSDSTAAVVVPHRVVKPTLVTMDRYWSGMAAIGVPRVNRILIGVEKNASGAMGYEDWDVERFLAWYLGLPADARFCHEFVYATQPCRLYVDLDRKLDDGRMEQPVWLAEWTRQVREVRDLLMAELGLPPGSQVQVTAWSNHRPGKLSTHLYYKDVWFESPGACGNFVRDVQTRHPLIMSAVDCAIYPQLPPMSTAEEAQTKRKPLRMPLSAKQATRKYSLSLDRELSIGLPPDLTMATALVQSLVSYYPSVHPPLPPQLHSWANPDVGRSSGSLLSSRLPGSALSDVETTRLLDWLCEWCGVAQISRVRPVDQGTSWHLPSVYCPMKGDRHVSNHMFMRLDGDTIWFTCTDCRFSFQAGVLARYILRNRSPYLDQDQQGGVLSDVEGQATNAGYSILQQIHDEHETVLIYTGAKKPITRT